MVQTKGKYKVVRKMPDLNKKQSEQLIKTMIKNEQNPKLSKYQKQMVKEMNQQKLKKTNQVYIEDCEEFMKESKTYAMVLEHRIKCPKWGKDFCLDCFGGGLTLFSKNLIKEGYLKKEYLKKDIEINHLRKDNHKIGCELESYCNLLLYRGFNKEHDMLLEVASRLK